MKAVLSWILAIIIAGILVVFFWKLMVGAAKIMLTLVMLVPILIIAIPIYVLIRKKFIRH